MLQITEYAGPFENSCYKTPGKCHITAVCGNLAEAEELSARAGRTYTSLKAAKKALAELRKGLAASSEVRR